MKRKIVYVISDVRKSLAFEWIADHLKKKADVFFLLIGERDTPLVQYLAKAGVPYEVVPHLGLPRTWMKVFNVLRREKPDIVHAHLWQAMLLGLTAATVLRIRRRIFTRHHATVHHVEYPGGLKWDKMCNRLATHIVAISESIRNIMVRWEGANPAKVGVIHHGFSLEYFQHPDPARVAALRQKYNLLPGQQPVIGVISRYTSWKGIQYTIAAFRQLRQQYGSACLVLANAHGEYAATIHTLLADLPPEAYREIVFEDDLASLYSLFDVFVHVPVDDTAEAFGQTYVEALAAGVPSVFTLSGVASEFIEHNKNAWVVGYKNSHEIADAISHLLSDAGLRQRLVANGKASVQQFDLRHMLDKLDALYA